MCTTVSLVLPRNTGVRRIQRYKTMRSERRGKGAAVTSESRKLAEGADKGGVASSWSPWSWTLIPQRMQSHPAALRGVWGCGEALCTL